jgi:hypothetical protein
MIRRMLIATAAALLWASPALAAKPTRTVIQQTGTVTIPAGFGCAFDVVAHLQPGARITFTEFSDGRLAYHEHANAILTNADTGATLYHRARFSGVDVYDDATGLVSSVTQGRVNVFFYPGDDGPFGTVAEPGAIYRFVGRISYLYDADTEAISDFSYSGSVTDVCAELSEP